MKLNKSWPILVKSTLLISLIGAHAQALTIDQYLEQAKQKNPLLKSYEESVNAAKLKAQSSDIDLSPLITAGYLNSTDQSKPSQLGTKREVQTYSLGVAKKFETGTALKFQAQSGQFNNANVTFPGFDKYSTGSLSLTVQQSLWKDFFGEGTRIKINRVQKTAQLEQYSAVLQSRVALYDVESNYLDYALAYEDLKLKKSNLERAQKIDKWTSARVSNGISDRADLMNAKALVSLREAQMLSAEEELKTQENKLRDNLKLADEESTPSIQADLNSERPYLKQLINKMNVQKIETYLAALEADVKLLVAGETNDSLKPDLSVFGTYATTSYSREFSDAMKDITQTDAPQNVVGVNFSWVFDTNSKNSLRESSQKEALAAQLKSEKKKTDGITAWNEVIRKYNVLKKSVQTLDQVAQYQRERAKAEQDKLAKGRTVTANVVTAETDAAEAEVTLLKTKSQLRKLETSSLFFMEVQE